MPGKSGKRGFPGIPGDIGKSGTPGRRGRRGHPGIVVSKNTLAIILSIFGKRSYSFLGKKSEFVLKKLAGVLL